jgi:hypothetical protein
MYERFTDRARKVMQLAGEEAARLNHEYIGTEHVLLGLVKEGEGVAANVLANLGVDPERVRREVERLAPAGPDAVPAGRLPRTPRTKKVIEYAAEEARALRHDHVGTEHLLLGLVREGEGYAAQALAGLGLTPDRVRREVLKLLGCDAPPADVVHLATGLNPEGTAAYSLADECPPAPLGAEQIRTVRERIRHLSGQQEVFAAATDFVLASRCREEAEALRQLLAWYEWIRGPQ